MRRRNWLILCALLILLIGSALYISRGYFRSTTAPAIASIFYAKQIDTAFDESFEQADTLFAGLNIPAATKVSDASCQTNTYEGAHLEITCRKQSIATSIDTAKLTITPQFITTWKSKSVAIEKELLQKGWQKTWNEKQPINELFDKPDEQMSIGVNYEKKIGQIACRLEIAYTRNSITDEAGAMINDYMYVGRDCSKFLST